MKNRTREYFRNGFILCLFVTLTLFQANALTGVEAGSLMHEFISAQKSEIKAFEHRKKFEVKELKSSQEKQSLEFEKKEKEARHEFFEKHSKGEERRAYVQDFIKRRDAFRNGLADERNRKNSELDSALKNIRNDQFLKLKQFRELIQKGETPSRELWPKAGI